MQKILRNAYDIAVVTHDRYLTSYEAVHKVESALKVKWHFTHLCKISLPMCEVMFSRTSLRYEVNCTVKHTVFCQKVFIRCQSQSKLHANEDATHNAQTKLVH